MLSSLIRKKIAPTHPPPDMKVLVFFGASGKVGTQLLKNIPEHFFVVNVSKGRRIDRPNTVNILADLEQVSPASLLKSILQVVGRVDIVVFGAVRVSQTPLLLQTEREMLREYKVNVHSAVLFLGECMTYFAKDGASKNMQRKRAVITLSSAITRHGVHGKEHQSLGPYAAQKSALEMSMRCVVHTLRDMGVGSAILAPKQVIGSDYIEKFSGTFWKLAEDGGIADFCGVTYVE